MANPLQTNQTITWFAWKKHKSSTAPKKTTWNENDESEKCKRKRKMEFTFFPLCWRTKSKIVINLEKGNTQAHTFALKWAQKRLSHKSW